ncbi:PREDICTED: nucleolar and spindle-associated protein 1 [Dipodomys ordii]|uniref:Nucleolar and spindle-associated protein 1 n=1 Tax=Dipodomys ordii TaxID=10020 RepID=A0A1S3EM64_DIPOR|nr:PREDICTED: nucleolar and spindle-associated protein 1 [Dipodomys ordii]
MSPVLQDAMTVPSAAELDSFKYGDLQNLAKSLGLRANLKADRLLKSLKAHLKLEARKENNSQGEKETAAFCDETETQMSSQDHAGKEPVVHVTKRKRRRHKRGHGKPDSQKQPGSKGKVVTPVPPRGRLPVACTPTQKCHSPGQSRNPARQSAVCLKGSVRRTTLSATKMNVRFSAATKDNEHKGSLTKTPARKSPHVSLSGITPKSQAVLGTPKLKTTKGNSASVITPFKLTSMAMKTPVSDKKPVFDLKASLSRPLNYEPHKGKLKPWGHSKENNSLTEHASRVSVYKKSYKQPPLQTREEQRKKREQERKEKKEKVLGARRGLNMIKNN